MGAKTHNGGSRKRLSYGSQRRDDVGAPPSLSARAAAAPARCEQYEFLIKPSGVAILVPDSSLAMDRMAVVYLAHTALEVCLGLIKLRGRYQHESPGERSAKSAMYVRHHAASLLSLAALSGLVQWRGLIHTETGEICNAVLAIFHLGAVCSFAHAWLCSRSFRAAKIIVPHAPFGVAFALALL